MPPLMSTKVHNYDVCYSLQCLGGEGGGGGRGRGGGGGGGKGPGGGGGGGMTLCSTVMYTMYMKYNIPTDHETPFLYCYGLSCVAPTIIAPPALLLAEVLAC